MNNYTEPKKALCGLCKEELIPVYNSHNSSIVNNWFCPKCNAEVNNVIYIYENK